MNDRSVRVLSTARDGEPVIARAAAGYFRSPIAPGTRRRMPGDESYCGMLDGKEYVVLKASGGPVLAVFRVRPSGLLKRLRRWPRELNWAHADGGTGRPDYRDLDVPF